MTQMEKLCQIITAENVPSLKKKDIKVENETSRSK